jgi:hypothetical protein
MWASQLLTLQTTVPNRKDIISDFTSVPNYVRVERIELVMFNCPEKGISVQSLTILAAQSLLEMTSELNIFIVSNITSCDSLVRVCIPLNTTQPVIYLRFNPPLSGSTWVHLAEVEFHESDSMCPPTAPATTLVDTTPQPTNAATTHPTTPTSSATIVVAVVSASCVVLLIVCLLAAVLILWRCYYVKHHQHNTTAEGEGHTHSHTQPVILSEETGQVYYSTAQEVAPQDSEDMYSHISRNSAAKEQPVSSSAGFREYSTLFFDESKIEADQAVQGDRKRAVHTPEGDMPVDLLYAQVDRKKKDRNGTFSHTPEAATHVDQQYARVDKKKKDGNSKKKDGTYIQTPEAATPVDQLYAQVDKKKTDGKNKKKDDTHNRTPEAVTPVDQLYAQVDKKKKSKEK